MDVDGMLLIDELVLLCVCDIKIGVVLILLDQFDDLFCVCNRMIVSLLIIRLTRWCLFHIVILKFVFMVIQNL